MEAKCKETLEASPVDFVAVAQLCRRGLPSTYRPTIWKLIMGFYPLYPELWDKGEKKSQEEYQKILEAVCTLDDDGNATGVGELHHLIDMDVYRTMSSMHFFVCGSEEPGEHVGTVGAYRFSPAQHALRRILYTLAGVNSGISYVQGMNEIVGHLLFAFCAGKLEGLTKSVESSVFFCFQTMLSYLGDDFCLSLDSDANRGVISTIRHFDHALAFFDVDVSSHLQTLGVCAEHFALRWIMLLFTQEFNEADCLRIWDFLLSFGDQLRSATLYVAVAMCHHLRDSLLSTKNLSEAIPLLHKYPVCDVSDFLRIAMRWIAKYDFAFMDSLKLATPEEITALRQTHGLVRAPGIGDYMKGLFQSVVGMTTSM